MKYVNVIDAKEQFTDLVTLLSSNPLEEVYLTFAGKPIIKMQPIKENLPLVPEEKNKPKNIRRRAGIAKGTFVLDDELFDSMDAEIDKMFFGGEAK